MSYCWCCSAVAVAVAGPPEFVFEGPGWRASELELFGSTVGRAGPSALRPPRTEHGNAPLDDG
eukprot:10697700-Alexandrium_andersonii.AAC.1